MAINFVKMFDPEQETDSPSAAKQKMALAQKLMGGESGPVYSGAAAAAKVAEKAAGGWLAGMIAKEEQAANEQAGSLIANALMNWGGAGSSAATPSAGASASAAPSTPPNDGGSGYSTAAFGGDPYTGGSDDASLYRQAIKDIESSGGNYGIVGPTHPKYGRALGAYQVMEANLPTWSKEVLGREVSPDEFLKDPGIQDRIFDAKFAQSVQQYGSPEDAASVWFTGRPRGGSADTAKDSLGTTGSGYVSKFAANLSRYRGQPSAPMDDAALVASVNQPTAPQGGPVQVASLDPSAGVASASPSPIAAPQAASAPVQVAQANPLAQALQAPPAAPQGMNPQQQEIVRQLLGNPRTRQAGMALIQQHQEQAIAAQKEQRDRAWDVQKLQVQRGYQVEDREDGQNFQRQQGETQRQFDERLKREGWTREDINAQTKFDRDQTAFTPDQKEYYNTYVPQEIAAGRTPQEFTPWTQANKKAGAQNINLPGAEKEEEKERGKGLATRLNKIAEDGDAAVMDMTIIQRMNALGNNVDPGSRTAFLEELRQRTGIQLDPKADDVQAFKAIINYMKPRMKVAGSGTSSDRDMESFEQALMNLRATPGGNEIIAQTLGGMAQQRIARGEIAQLWQLGEISAKDAADRMKALPDPFDTFKQWQKQNPNAPKGNPAATVAPKPEEQLKAAPAPTGYPADAKQAPDGNWYVPDPDRPGKYLRVQ
jgi:hypothetical protein